MASPPPTLPGMPWANSRPVSECWAAKTARALSVAPAPARCARRPGGCSAPMGFAMQTDRALKPSSGTSRLVPVAGYEQPRAGGAQHAAGRPRPPAAEPGSSMSRAGPPILKEQRSLMGSFSRISSPGSGGCAAPAPVRRNQAFQNSFPESTRASCSRASASAAL